MPEMPKLRPEEEDKFKDWARRNNIRDPLSPLHQYDNVSAFRSGVNRGPGGHFPDTYKMPGHPTFSEESIYAKPPYKFGSWEGEKFIPYEESIKKSRKEKTMPEYRPIPGQTDRGPSPMSPAMDDLSVMARGRASNILSPYANIGNSGAPPPGQENPVNPNSGGVANPVPIPGGSSSIEDKLYQSIHPDTFSKVLETIMQFVTGKPISRQRGGQVDTDKDYIVGEQGPERFRPSVPGQIIPRGEPTATPMGPVQGGLRYGGRLSDAEIMGKNVPPPSSAEFSRWELGVPGERSEATPNLPVPYTGARPWRGPTRGPGEDFGGYRERTREEYLGVPSGLEGWKDYPGEGMGYQWSGPETAETRAGDEAARRRMERESPEFRPIPGKGPGPGGSYLRSYYEAHPEERFRDEAEAENSRLMDQYRSAKTGAEKDRLMKMMEGNKIVAQGYYKTAMEQGAGSPAAQEKLAHAEYLRKYPEVHMAGISLQGQQHLAAVNAQVEGHLKTAELAAGTKDPILKSINQSLATAQKATEMTGQPYNPEDIVAKDLQVFHDTGKISDQEYNKLPSRYRPPTPGAKWGTNPETGIQGWYIPNPKKQGSYRLWTEEKE